MSISRNEEAKEDIEQRGKLELEVCELQLWREFLDLMIFAGQIWDQISKFAILKY